MRVIIYVRVSTQEQAREGYSIGEQIDRLTRYCEAMRWTIVRTYTDPGFSGATMDRPGLNALIHDAQAGLTDRVLVYKLDRLSRSQLDTLYLIEKVFLANDVDFISMSENFDTSTPFGRAMVGILAVFAQLEREQIRERMMMGKAARGKEGLYHGGVNTPIGYDYQDGHLVVNDWERAQIAEAFRLAAGGMAPARIAERFSEAGYAHKYGPWNGRSVKRVLRNRAYLGYIQHVGKWYKGEHEAIVSEEIFDRVQRILDQRSEQYLVYNRRPGKATSYLGGFVYCKKCGARYIRSVSSYLGKSGQRLVYKKFICASRDGRKKGQVKDPACKNKIWKEEELTELVFGEIRKLAADPEHMIRLQAEKADDDRPAVIRAEIGKLDDQIARLMDLYTVDQMPLELLQERIHKLADRKARLEAELTAADQKPDLDVIRLVSSFGDILDRGDFDEIRTVISSLIERIEIDGDLIEIHWRF
jgi:site-specific DNA recombinase